MEECKAMVLKVMQDGSALERLKAMVKAQGGDACVIEDCNNFEKAPYSHEVKAQKSGYITHMDTEKCGISSVILGAGRETKESDIDFTAGIILKAKYGDSVQQGDVIATMYSSDQSKFQSAEELFQKAITICDEKPKQEQLIYARIEKDKVERF